MRIEETRNRRSSLLFLASFSLVLAQCADSQQADTPETIGGGQGDVQLDPQCVGAEEGVACNDNDACTINETCKSGVCGGGIAVECSAPEECKTAICDPVAGCLVTNVSNGSLCNVNCYEEATCAFGKCNPTPGTEKTCPPSPKLCVESLGCDPLTDECTVENLKTEGTGCDNDGNVCTTEICDNKGECKVAAGVAVDDCSVEQTANPCWQYSCDPKSGCVKGQFIAGVKCNDNDACTFDDTCTVQSEDGPSEDSCVGTAVVVDDQNPCTIDKCASGLVTHNPDIGGECTPVDQCATSGQCDAAGKCEALDPCECVVDADCPQPTNPCEGQKFCNTLGDKPKCDTVPGTNVICEDSGNACKALKCNPETLQCDPAPLVDGSPCDDGDACTVGTVCKQGQCDKGTPVDCSDGLFCNGPESCDPINGCGPAEFAELDDGHDCTLDTCDEQNDVVLHIPNDSMCDDTHFCNGKEKCDVDNGCVQGLPPQMSDGIKCTADACIEDTDTIVHIVDDSLCDDGDVCNGEDVCHPELDCLPDLDSKLPPDGAPCSDQSQCTQFDHCKDGTCVGELLSCDDSNDCTYETCDPIKGCEYANHAEAWKCFSGNPCSHQGKCDGSGTCIAQTKTDGSSCVDLKYDKCVLVAFCDQGDCTVSPECEKNLTGKDCKDGLLVCDDGNPCTDDSCDAASGCVFTPNEDPCEDGNKCTLTGVCFVGKCIKTTPVDCSAIDNCHLDGVCNPDTGQCTTPLKENKALCDDGNACTQPDVCTDGLCSGSLIDCDDDNSCTTDSCDPLTGCLHTGLPDDTECQDGNGCTQDTFCKSGFCGGGSVVKDGTVCSDGDSCTENTSCVFGLCADGKPVDCSDSNPCTVDTCDPDTGCEHKPIEGPCDVGCWCTKGQCTSGDEGYSTQWANSWNHYLSTKPDSLSPVPPVGAGQGPGLVLGELVWLQSLSGSTLWINRQGKEFAHWASSIEVYRPSHSTVTYTILGTPSASQGSLSRGVILWLYKTNTVSAPQKVEVQVVTTLNNGTISKETIYTTELNSIANQWTRIRAEFETGLQLFSIYIGTQLLGTWSLDDQMLQSTHIGLSSAALMFAPEVGWRNLKVDKGELVQFIPPACQPPACGDGLKNQILEECDDGNLDNGDGCSATCKEEAEVLVPAGPFWRGCDLGLAPECTSDAQPMKVLQMSAYSIDRYEVTVADFHNCVDAKICKPPQVDDPDCNWPSKMDRPVNCVTWEQAAIYCVWVGKSLPTEAQWEKAARGGCDLYPDQDCKKASVKYPWGNTAPNCEKAVLTGCSGDEKSHSIQPGSRPQGASPYGAYDMAGNVAEWVSDWYSPNYYAEAVEVNPSGPAQGVARGVRGGSYLDSVFGSSKVLTTWHRVAGDEDAALPSIGFRCSFKGQ